MKQIFLFSLSILLFTGCTFTFSGSVFVITISDLLLYIFVAFIIALVSSLIKPEKRLSRFWITFIVGLLLTPLVSFIYLLIIFSRKAHIRNESDGRK